VIAHELAHIKNRDTLIMTIAATLAGAIGMLANMAQWALLFGRSSEDEEGASPLAGLAGIIVAPIAAMLIQMWISRTREYQADASAAEVVGSPNGLASALQKLENYSKRIPMEASPSTAHMLIMHPFSGGSLMSLFSTHPSTQKRIARLMGRSSHP